MIGPFTCALQKGVREVCKRCLDTHHNQHESRGVPCTLHVRHHEHVIHSEQNAPRSNTTLPSFLLHPSFFPSSSPFPQTPHTPFTNTASKTGTPSSSHNYSTASPHHRTVAACPSLHSPLPLSLPLPKSHTRTSLVVFSTPSIGAAAAAPDEPTAMRECVAFGESASQKEGDGVYVIFFLCPGKKKGRTGETLIFRENGLSYTGGI